MSLTIERHSSIPGEPQVVNLSSPSVSLGVHQWATESEKIELVNAQLETVQDAYLKACIGSGCLLIVRESGGEKVDINAWVEEDCIELIADCHDTQKRIILTYALEPGVLKVAITRVTQKRVDRFPSQKRPFRISEHAKWLVRLDANYGP